MAEQKKEPGRPGRKSKLSDREKRFAEEYLIDLNATQAAIRAGYAKSGAEKMGYDLLRRPRVAELIAQGKEARSERTKIDADWLLQRLADEADADLKDLYGEDGNLKPVHEWPVAWRKGLVAGIEVEELWEGRGEERQQIGVLRKVKIADRAKRLELIGRHVDVQAFKERVEHDTTPPMRKLFEQIAGRSIAPRDSDTPAVDRPQAIGPREEG